jgi:predicted DNA binding CopG/RHH family protein
MNQKIISTIIIFGLLTVIPTAYGQLSLGSEAKQELIEVKINPDGEINVKHVVSPSNMPTTVPLFLGEISNLIITDDLGEEINSGTANDAKGNLSVLLLPSNQNSIITYNLENMKINNNLFNTEISYPQKFSVIFEESINLIFLNNNVLFLDDKKGVAINGGGNMKIEFYSTESKIIEKATWEENEFDVEIITDSKIENFNFDQTSKSISFEVNEENKFVTIIMSEELLGGPYVILLDTEKIQYTKSEIDGYVTLSMKPELTGEITIIGTTVIPEFSMFIPLIMGFLIILTVPFVKKINLH